MDYHLEVAGGGLTQCHSGAEEDCQDGEESDTGHDSGIPAEASARGEWYEPSGGRNNGPSIKSVGEERQLKRADQSTTT